MSRHADRAQPMRETVTADVIAADCPQCNDEVITVHGAPGVGDCANCGFSAFVEVGR